MTRTASRTTRPRSMKAQKANTTLRLAANNPTRARDERVEDEGTDESELPQIERESPHVDQQDARQVPVSLDSVRKPTGSPSPVTEREATRPPRPASRADVLHELASIMDNLERMAWATKWERHFRSAKGWDPQRAKDNHEGAQHCHRLIVQSVLTIGKIAVPNDPYLTTELTMRMAAIRSARL